IKGKHEDISDAEDGEFRRSGRKGKHQDKIDGEDGEIRKRERKGRSRRSKDEDDRKDRRRRGRNKDSSDGEDDKYKRQDRNRNRDDSDDDGRRRDGKRDRRSNGDPKDSRRNDDVSKRREDKNGDKENVDEGPRFQKLAEMQEGMTNLGKSGGVYIPPFKLARMMSEVQDKSSMEYQRMTWDALKKSINGLVNKVNATNIKNIIPELFAENLIRGRGLFCRSCMKSQMASPGFTDVFAALVAVVNTKFPEVGNLLLRRIILQLQRAYKRNDKHQLLAAVKFIAHLVNQQVVDELIALELLTTLLENPTDDSVEVAVGFITECGSILQDLSPKGLHAIFERFRGILHEGEIDKRVQYLIEGLFALRKAKFQGHPAVRPELDLVESEDQITHEVSLLDKIDPEIALDIFKLDPDFIENEKRYEELKKSLLGDESEAEEEENGEDSDDDDDDEDESSEEEDEEQMRIRDETETNLVNLRRTIYLTIMSSVDFEEAGHKLLKIKLEPGQEMELCIMLLECCSQERTYLRYYGLLGQRFCMINKVHQENFEKCFVQQYSMIHRLETNKLRNVAKFFAHLLGTDALPWHVLAYIRLTEEDTTSSSRIFIKILFQELSEQLGIRLLNERLSDPTMQADFESIFPRDNPKNTRFSINFFTSIGLGGITENLREYLKNMPRLIMQQKPASESDNSDSSSSGSDSSSSSESDSSDSESESDHKRSKRRRKH
ncbi:pre-mRNA-splicing factor CWC22, partial [Tanacetum coccineum]